MTWDSICNYWHSPYFTFVIFCLWSILLCAPNNLLGDIKTDQRKACLGGGNATELTFRNVWSTEDSLGLGQPASRAALMHSLNVFILCLCECVFLYAVYQTKIEDLRKGRHIALHWMCITGAYVCLLYINSCTVSHSSVAKFRLGGHFALFCPRQAPTTAIPGTLWTSAAVDNGLRCESRVFCALAQKLSWKSTFQKRPFHNGEEKSKRVTLSHKFFPQGLARHCSAKTTFTIHFSIMDALESIWQC